MNECAYWAISDIFVNKEKQKRIMIVFKTRRCRKKIKCSVCGFEAHSLDQYNTDILSQYKNLENIIINEQIEHIDILSSGSMLDSEQVDYNQVIALIREIRKNKNIKSVLIEGRVDFCEKKKINEIKSLLGDIYFEYGIGLESFFTETRNTILKKELQLDDYIDCVKMLTREGVGVCSYVLFGIPGFSQKESEIDAVESIINIAKVYRKNKASGRIALYPVFITPGNIIEKMYIRGEYKLTTLKEVINIVRKTNKKIDFKKLHLFVGLDDEGISGERSVCSGKGDDQPYLELINLFNKAQEI